MKTRMLRRISFICYLCFIIFIKDGGALTCLHCQNARSHKDCERRGKIEHCHGGNDACMTLVRVDQKTGKLQVTKQCKQHSACINQVELDFCEIHHKAEKCLCCCDGDQCNKGRKSCFPERKGSTGLYKNDPRPDRSKYDPAKKGWWSHWSEYSECSKTCGDGVRRRTRTCKRKECPGEAIQTMRCRIKQCPAVCTVIGGPHYTSFDGKGFDFQGLCSYVLVRNISHTEKPFLVELHNQASTSKGKLPMLKKVLVKFGEDLKVEVMRGKTVKVNEVKVGLPYVNSEKGIDVRYNGRFVRLSTSLDLGIDYDGDSHLVVEVSNKFIGKVEGLCGNYNTYPADDFRLSGSLEYTNSVDFGNAFQISTPEKCAFQRPPADEDPCTPGVRNKFVPYCLILLQEDGCFSKCHPEVEANRYYENCISDSCVYDDERTAVENNVGAYAKACQDRSIEICDWRAITETPLQCSPNSHYSLCSSPCPATCAMQVTSTCDKTCVEGCDCDEGFLRSGDTCVREENCGCDYQGSYYAADESFFPSCSTKCICQEGKVKCSTFSCQSGETCGRDRNGRTACVPTGHAICWAAMDPHYQTFDGRYFSYMGTCNYQMVLTHKLNSTDPRWLSVQAANKHRYSNTQVSYLDYVTVQLPGSVVEMHQSYATLNGETIQAYDSSLFKITRSGRSVYLTTQYGVGVTFHGNRVVIELPSTYMNMVHGLCGNYNENHEDDFETESGILAFDLNEFAKSYLVGDCLADDPASSSTCLESSRTRWSGSQYCGLLTNPSDVFAPCHALVNPVNHFQSCVFDLCATDGDDSVLEMAFESYAAACQERGVSLCNWREITGTVRLNCPSNSHYEGCANPCPDTCSDPFASADCPLPGYVEDCVCNIGYVRDGDYCVRKSECGQILDGKYISKTCLEPSTIKNGYFEDQNPPDPYFENDSILYKCNDGFALIGPSASVCGSDGRWSLTNSNLPQCKRACGNPPAISNGYFDNQHPSHLFVVGKQITYHCNGGFALVGFSASECGADGSWSLTGSSLPGCRAASSESCKAILDAGFTTNGVYTIRPFNEDIQVYCDQETDGGGWMIFQRRLDGSVDFKTSWVSYVNGFGTTDGEHWLGLEILHRITTSSAQDLRVDLEDFNGNKRYAKYSTFRVGSSADNYRLSVRDYSGNAGDGMSAHTGISFSSVDRDNDKAGNFDCSGSYNGGWWYDACYVGGSNLNGVYIRGSHSNDGGVDWMPWLRTYSLKTSEMKIRPK
ncbi:zonadhesin-like isoform X1 [Clavelina lepadiformis]|uniref:zonadhesin-like isoform X1 n=1 Tax=Clavelina lepadiformis TaxID=159417 RepID=UPI0040438FAA